MTCVGVVLSFKAKETEGGEERVRYLAKPYSTHAPDMFDSLLVSEWHWPS